MLKNKVRKLFIIALSAALAMGLASCGASDAGTVAEDTEAEAVSGAEEVTETSVAEEETETGPEEALEAAGETKAVGTVQTTARAEWALKNIAKFAEIVTGITDREYEAGEGANYKIYEDITYNRDIVCTVLFNTGGVRFDEPGTYDMTYWVYFDAAALGSWASEKDVSLEGWLDGNATVLGLPDGERLAVWVSATVTVKEPKQAKEQEDTETAAASDSGKKTSSGSSKSSESSSKSNSSNGSSSKSGSSSASNGNSSSSSSGSSKATVSSSGNSGGSAASCDHDWVEITREEDVYEMKELSICNVCGEDITGHTGEHGKAHALAHEGGGDHSEWVSVKVGTKTVGTGTYKCSKCGATK